MARRSDGKVLRQVRTLFDLGVIGELTDGQLLERFATSGGEAAELAFAALVERHGSMVLRICRHALRDPNDVEDAFQATFLVLVQRARWLWVEDSLAPWIHRVARRIAARARSAAARRRDRERRAAEGRTTIAPGIESDDGLMALLHEEIDRLPERCRVPLVLCDLEGLTHEQAARHLSWPIGTVKSRLNAGRERLRARLVRRGVAPAVALLKVTMTTSARSALAAVPAGLVEATVRSARLVAAGAGTTAAGAVPASIALLMEGALNTMFVTRIKFALWICGLIAGGAVVAAQQAGRTVEGVRTVPAPARVATPATARPGGPEDDEAAVKQEMDRLEVRMLEDEVELLRTQVNNALGDMIRLEASPGRQEPRSVKAAQAAHQALRELYWERARELATRRRRLGQRPPGATWTDNFVPNEERGQGRQARPSGSDTSAAAIGTIDMDAVLKRYAKVQRSQERVSAARDDYKERLSKLEFDAGEIQARLNRHAPNDRGDSALEDQLAAVKKDLEIQRERAERDLTQRQTWEMARLFEDVQDVIAAVAKARGLDYVVKVEARLEPNADPNQVLTALNRSVLYANPQSDITEEVIRELNRRFDTAGDKSPR